VTRTRPGYSDNPSTRPTHHGQVDHRCELLKLQAGRVDRYTVYLSTRRVSGYCGPGPWVAVAIGACPVLAYML
jgi:hypothetical protein